ncbi:MAG TPA: hypothetical protein VJB58_01370 [Candidatus Paceibacterota bacterium]
MEGLPKSKPERISSYSPEYREIREKMRERVPESARIFGESELEDVDNMRKHIEILKDWIGEEKDEENIKKWKEHIEAFERYSQNNISRLKERLREAVKRGPVDTIPFFEVASVSENIEQMLRSEVDYFDKIEKKIGYDEDTLFILFEDGLVSDKVFEEMVRVYVKLWEKRQEQFHERIPQILATFRDNALQAIKEGKLPITEELLEERMGDTRVYLADDLQIKQCTSGDYDVGEGAIRVAYRENIEAQEKTVFHEMIHALSGRTILIEEKGYFPDEMLEHQRVGFRFNVYDKNGDWAGKRFRWLNEAVTEEIAVELSKANPEHQSYHAEREKLKELYDSGLSKKLVYEAYFENYDPDSKDKIPKWKGLIKTISNIESLIGNISATKHLKNIEEKLER